jgi:hypothetical protein
MHEVNGQTGEQQGEFGEAFWWALHPLGNGDLAWVMQGSLNGLQTDWWIDGWPGAVGPGRADTQDEEGGLEPGPEDDRSKIKWAISTFKPLKSAGTDGIVPSLLQHGVEHLALHLCRIFRACLAYGYVPFAWRQTRVTFIPKPGKAIYTEAKAYRSISLWSVLIKTTDRWTGR